MTPLSPGNTLSMVKLPVVHPQEDTTRCTTKASSPVFSKEKVWQPFSLRPISPKSYTGCRKLISAASLFLSQEVNRQGVASNEKRMPDNLLGMACYSCAANAVQNAAAKPDPPNEVVCVQVMEG